MTRFGRSQHILVVNQGNKMKAKHILALVGCYASAKHDMVTSKQQIAGEII